MARARSGPSAPAGGDTWSYAVCAAVRRDGRDGGDTAAAQVRMTRLNGPLEVAFRDADNWVTFRHLPAVTAALDAVPDPVNGLMIYQGRGGSSASSDPRRPFPRAGAGAAPIPQEPDPIIVARLG